MRSLSNSVLTLLILTTFSIGVLAQSKPYQVTDRQVNTILSRIESKRNLFQRQIQTALDRSIYNDTDTEITVTGYLRDFEQSTLRLKNNFIYKSSTNVDVQEVLQRAAFINNFMRTTRLNTPTQTQWNSLRNDLNTLSGYYKLAWNWNNLPHQNRLAYSTSAANVQNAINNLEKNTNTFKREIGRALDRSALNTTNSENSLNQFISEFESATNGLKNNFKAGSSTVGDVENILSKGYIIDGFMRDYQLQSQAENQWKLVRQDLNNLAGFYAVSMNWDQPIAWNNQYDTRLDGTYRLNKTMSDDVNAVIRSVTKNYYAGQPNESATQTLQRRLRLPEYLVVDKNGLNVTLAANGTPSVTFQADGITRNEKVSNRNVKVTGRTNYESLSINYETEKMNNYFVNLMPMANGKLKVTRRINLENRKETVTTSAVYDKVNNIPDFAWLATQTTTNAAPTRGFYISNGTQLSGRLNESLSTQNLKDGDRFSINVTVPSKYSGATIYGYVSNIKRSGIISGRANMTFVFDQIRLKNGATYSFSGIVEQVTDNKGNRISVNNEGVGSQTPKPAIRNGVGAGAGVVIGTIIAGGAGVGSVIVQERGDIKLGQGSQIVITASAPSVANR